MDTSDRELAVPFNLELAGPEPRRRVDLALVGNAMVLRVRALP